MSIKWYDQHAEAFFAQTVSVDITNLHTLFLELLPSGSNILDAGCGSGRDSKVFLERGYKVTAFDASSEMASLAAKWSGLEVLCMRFDEIDWQYTFDGIWACSSLLHVPRAEFSEVFQLLWKSLKPGGIIYASFKLGKDERFQNERYFNDQNEASLEYFFASLPTATVIRLWRTSDPRSQSHAQVWINVLVRKR
jgi:SAM-dependent methyltransferase